MRSNLKNVKLNGKTCVKISLSKHIAWTDYLMRKIVYGKAYNRMLNSRNKKLATILRKGELNMSYQEYRASIAIKNEAELNLFEEIEREDITQIKEAHAESYKLVLTCNHAQAPCSILRNFNIIRATRINKNQIIITLKDNKLWLNDTYRAQMLDKKHTFELTNKAKKMLFAFELLKGKTLTGELNEILVGGKPISEVLNEALQQIREIEQNLKITLF